MKNPWEEIKLSDYESHMKLNTVMQAQCLNAIMKQQFYRYPVKTVLVLGIAGGNGLEHIDSRIEKVYGVDINREYLTECKARYPKLGGILECVRADLTEENAVLPQADLVIADLFIEYVGYDCFAKAVAKINPKVVSAVIQINADEGYVSDSPYLHVFDQLDSVHHQMEEGELTQTMDGVGYRLVEQEEYLMPNGKKLVRLDYKR